MTDKEWIDSIKNVSTEELFEKIEFIGCDGYYGDLWYAIIEELKNRVRPTGKCKSCKYYNPYFEQLTHIPRGDGYCAIARMTPEGMTYINCRDEWFCSDFCPKCGEDMKGGRE